MAAASPEQVMRERGGNYQQWLKYLEIKRGSVMFIPFFLVVIYFLNTYHEPGTVLDPRDTF